MFRNLCIALAVVTVVGSLASAQERQFGTLDSQAMLPVSSAQQWAVKEFKKMGCQNVHLEQWGEAPVGWQRGNLQVAKMVGRPRESRISKAVRLLIVGIGKLGDKAITQLKDRCRRTLEQIQSDLLLMHPFFRTQVF